jgi:multidrug efflux pump
MWHCKRSKDAIDKAKQDLPTDLTQEPTALEVSFSDQPIMYVNISGDYDQQRLKKFADDMKDRWKTFPSSIGWISSARRNANSRSM